MNNLHPRRFPTRAAVHLAIGAGLWTAAAIYLGNGFFDLLLYAAPAAIAGLTVGWVAHVFAQRQFTWRTGAETAYIGALYVTPFVGAFIVLSTSFGPATMLLAITLGAWVIVIVALAGGALLYFGRTVSTRGRRRRAAARVRRVYRRVRGGRRPRRSTGRGMPAVDGELRRHAD